MVCEPYGGDSPFSLRPDLRWYVTPAQAGVQGWNVGQMLYFQPWIPAFAGMTLDGNRRVVESRRVADLLLLHFFARREDFEPTDIWLLRSDLQPAVYSLLPARPTHRVRMMIGTYRSFDGAKSVAATGPRYVQYRLDRKRLAAACATDRAPVSECEQESPDRARRSAAGGDFCSHSQPNHRFTCRFTRSSTTIDSTQRTAVANPATTEKAPSVAPFDREATQIMYG